MSLQLDASNEKVSRFGWMTSFICIATNLTQLPVLVELGITSKLSMIIWLAFAFMCFISNINLVIPKGFQTYLGLTVLFLIIYLISGAFNSAYFDSALPWCIFLSAFVAINGLMAGKNLNNKDIDMICSSYVISGLIVTGNVFLKYIYGQSLTERMYLYGSKNSVSQILLTCWIIILLTKIGNSKKTISVKTMFYLGCFLFLTYVMLALKSRATIIGMPIIAVWCFLNGNKNKKLRNIVFLLFIAVTVFLIVNRDAYDFLVNNILSGGRDTADLNDMSSGRLDEWKNFGKDFADTWLFGHGRDKRESLILTSLLEFGIIGGGIILIIAIFPFALGVKNLKNNKFYILFTSIALVYFVNGIFEQLAPFGPGVKCYLLWFLFGILMATKEKDFLQKETQNV